MGCGKTKCPSRVEGYSIICEERGLADRDLANLFHCTKALVSVWE